MYFDISKTAHIIFVSYTITLNALLSFFPLSLNILIYITVLKYITYAYYFFLWIIKSFSRDI